MRTLHEQYRDRGFTILAFPCNQFGAQEPGTDAEILEFASTKYGANFPLFSKIEVNGDGACPLYRMLTATAPEADGKADIPWNFTKFLVDRDGTVVGRWAPTVTPEDLVPEIERLLG